MAQRPFELARTRVTLFEALLRARDQRGGKYPILEDHERKVLSRLTLLARVGEILGSGLHRQETLHHVAHCVAQDAHAFARGTAFDLKHHLALKAR